MFQNVTFSPCPHCGGTGRILDGAYSALEGVIHSVLGHPTLDLLERLEKIVAEAQAKKLPRDQIIERIEQQTPELSGLSKYLPQDFDHLCKAIALLGALAAFMITECRKQSDQKIEPTPQIVQQYIDNSVNLFYSQQQGGQNAD
jgi:hypothetical protein